MCLERLRRTVGPAAAAGDRPDPGAQQAADHEAQCRRHDQPADEVEPRPTQDQADPDPDEDQRPQLPDAAELVVGQLPGPDEERDRAGDDQEDAPAQVPAAHVHGPEQYSPGARAQRPNVTFAA